MGRKQAQALLAALISTPIAAQDNLLVNGGFQQGLSGWYETGPGGVYDGCGPAGGYCYVFSYATGIVQQTVTTQANYTGFIVGFEYRLPCNNSIGGYCTNPNGPVDWLTANLNLYLGDTQVQSVPLLSVQSYQPNYASFSLTGTAPEFNTATITFSGQDIGFWAGPYGPQIDRVSLSFENPPPPPPLPEPEPEPVVAPPAAIDPAPDVSPDPTQEVLQNEPEPVQEDVVVEEPVAETEMASEAVEETASEEAIVSDDIAEPQDESQAEDANDEPLSPDQLSALSAIEASNAPSDEEFQQAMEAVSEEAASAEAARIAESAPPVDVAENQNQAPQDVQIEEAASNVASEQPAPEMTIQQEVSAQPDMLSNTAIQQDETPSSQMEMQQSTQVETLQRSATPNLEAVDINQSQASENVLVSAPAQEQPVVVIEQSATEIQQVPQQAEQAKEPERLIDGIISSLEGYQDINTAFFHKEAIEDADTFQRERVIPVNVADVATVVTNNAQLAQNIGEQTTTETPAGTYDIVIVDGPTFMPTPTTGMGDMTNPVGQAQQMELLGMNGMQNEMAAGQPTDIGDVNSGDSETMSQLAAIPAGYSAYTQARIPDAPFYQPRDIYKGRRIPDANMALYRMMQGQDSLWQDMVDEQYE